MNEPNSAWRSLTQAVEQAASSPKVSLTVAATSATVAGAAREIDLFTDAVTKYTITVGALTGTVVLAIQLIKMIRVWKAWRADQPDPKD